MTEYADRIRAAGHGNEALQPATDAIADAIEAALEAVEDRLTDFADRLGRNERDMDLYDKALGEGRSTGTAAVTSTQEPKKATPADIPPKGKH